VFPAQYIERCGDRLRTGDSLCIPGLPDVEVPDDLLTEARAVVAVETGLPPEVLELVGADRVEWPNSCLGCGGPAESCLTVITPGYRILFEGEGEVYEVRTDLEGEAVRLCDRS
jgi:hypothetical protein